VSLPYLAPERSVLACGVLPGGWPHPSLAVPWVPALCLVWGSTRQDAPPWLGNAAHCPTRAGLC